MPSPIQKVKMCWLARETRDGWKLGAAFERDTFWIPKVRFGGPKDIEKALKRGIVFVYLAGSKEYRPANSKRRRRCAE